MVINIMILFVILAAVPEILGMIYTSFLPQEENGILLNWVAGFLILWGLFEIIALPLIFLRRSLDFLCILYGGVILAAMLFALVRSRSRLRALFRDALLSVKGMALVGWANLLLVLGQAYVYVRYLHDDGDDAFYVGAAVTAVSTNTIFSIDPYTGVEYVSFPARYVLSPFFSFNAFLSRVSGLHPAVTAHLALAAALIVLAYAVYALLGRRLFPDNSRCAEYFLLFVIAVFLFSGYTVYTQGMFALVRIWQGKAVFCAALAPMICYMMLRIGAGQMAKADWFLLAMLMCSCCMVSSMGIMLGAVMLGIFGILNFIRNRDWRTFFYTFLCSIPNLICAGIYVVMR